MKLSGLEAGNAATVLVVCDVNGVGDRRRVQGTLIGQAGLERDRGLGVDLGPCGVGALGCNGIRNETFPRVRCVVRGQETLRRVAGRHIKRRGVDGCEGPFDQTGLLIELSVDVHVNAGCAAGVDARLVRFQAGRHRVELPAEAEIAELEGAPIEVRIELLGDFDDLHGAGAEGLFSKLMA